MWACAVCVHGPVHLCACAVCVCARMGMFCMCAQACASVYVGVHVCLWEHVLCVSRQGSLTACEDRVVFLLIFNKNIPVLLAIGYCCPFGL